ncbi:MAG: anthranilate synthase component I [Alphaproteobacteria bacterium]|nr:anthranilate synthase component I [Alphaproteobacteria bacterium]
MTPCEPSFEAFAARFAAGGALVWTRRISDLETPVSALLKLGADRPGAFLFESVQGGDWRGRYSIIGLKPDLIWRVRDGRAEMSAGRFDDAAFKPDTRAPLDSLRRLIAQSALPIPEGLPPPAAGLFGYLAYEMVREVETLPPCAPDPLGLPQALLMRPTIVAVFDTVASEIILVTPARPGRGRDAASAYESARRRLDTALRALERPAPRISSAAEPREPPSAPQSNIEPARYREIVEACKAYTRKGDIFQVVPSQRFTTPLAAPPFALYRALRRLNPSPFLFYLNFNGFAVVGSSPEILVRLREGVVTIRPIAGTRPRGKTPAQDRANEDDLLADPKERAEHLMLLDLGRNDVGRVAARGRGANDGKPNVRVTESFAVERYSHVMHIVSNVEGRIAPDKDAVDALFAGFPAGTVSGAPKVRAMEIINAMEPHARGVYGGGVGYFSAGGEMDTCIALRTGVVKDGALHVQAGGGVVLDSDPQLELEETQHKAAALFRAAAEAWRYS